MTTAERPASPRMPSNRSSMFADAAATIRECEKLTALFPPTQIGTVRTDLKMRAQLVRALSRDIHHVVRTLAAEAAFWTAIDPDTNLASLHDAMDDIASMFESASENTYTGDEDRAC